MVRIHPAVPDKHITSKHYEQGCQDRQIYSPKRTYCGPSRTRFFLSHPRLTVSKRGQIVALADVGTVFDDRCIRELAKIAKLPADADLGVFGWWIREAACLFACDARAPTANELHEEIATLQKAAERKRFEQVGDLLDNLSQEARAMLSTLHGELPTSRDLRDEALRETACDAVRWLCGFGGELAEGRRRPSGKQSRATLRPHLYAPQARRNFMKRDAERYFVVRLSVAWCHVAGRAPPRTVRHRLARQSGPFVRFVRKCLDLAGATYADVVELIRAVRRDPFYEELLGKCSDRLSDIKS